jgi:hypothetical protein
LTSSVSPCGLGPRTIDSWPNASYRYFVIEEPSVAVSIRPSSLQVAVRLAAEASSFQDVRLPSASQVFVRVPTCDGACGCCPL